MEYNINKLLKEIDFDKFKLQDNGNGLLLTNYEIDVLKRNGFNYQKYTNINELLYEIDEYLNIEYNEELEYILDKLNERHYYNDINK